MNEVKSQINKTPAASARSFPTTNVAADGGRKERARDFRRKGGVFG